MSIHDALYAITQGHAGLAALIGTRFYPKRLPQGATLPACTYHRISEVPVQAFGADPGLVRARFQVDAWGETAEGDGGDGFGDAVAVGEQVVAAFRRYRGAIGGVTILYAEVEGRPDTDEERAGRLLDRQVYDVVVDYR